MSASSTGGTWAVSDFLSERELAISASDPSTFYQELDEVLGSLSVHAHTAFGSELDDQPAGETCFFRGQSSATWGLSSSLYRLYEDRFASGYVTEAAEQALANAERQVLETARANGIVRGLTGLERLTILQHHGAPTRLVDVSTDWRVALYFACEELDAEDGRLFVISTCPKRWTDFRKPLNDDQSLVWWDKQRLKGLDWKQSVWPVLLPFTDSRMVAQRGYFLVGGLTSDRGGHHFYHGRSKKNAPLSNAEMRRVSSLAIEFPNVFDSLGLQAATQKFLKRRPKSKWTASAITIRIPASIKPGIRGLLAKQGVSRDDIYPPVAETTRLLKHVAAE